MKKIFKRALPLLLAAVMLISSAPFAALLTLNVSATEYQVGDIVEFGSYPQGEVKDAALISELNSQNLNWVSYGYYSGNGYAPESSDYMKYTDIEYNGVTYRAVKFTDYRPIWTNRTSSDSNQPNNGYKTNTTYWFEYKPIKWQVLDPNEGLIISKTIIDSQAYNNDKYSANDEYWNNSSHTNYANDYETSSIREWLNDDFYNLAFTSDQQSSIKTTTLDNSAYSDERSQYDSATTKDKVFLLSYGETLNTQYGFTSSAPSNKAREARGSDYAKCQGLHVNTDSNSGYSGNSYWILRSPGTYSSYSCGVGTYGYVSNDFDVMHTFYGIRPALKISNLSSLVVVGNINGNKTNAVVPENNNEIIYIAIIAAVILGIVFNIVIIFVATKKKKSRKSNTALNSDIEEKSAKTDKQSDETEKISDKPKTSKHKSKPMHDLMKIISYAPLTDEQLEAINKKLNPKN